MRGVRATYQVTFTCRTTSPLSCWVASYGEAIRLRKALLFVWDTAQPNVEIKSSDDATEDIDAFEAQDKGFKKCG